MILTCFFGMNGAAVNNGYPRLMLQRSTNQMVLLVSYLMHARNLKWTEFCRDNSRQCVTGLLSCTVLKGHWRLFVLVSFFSGYVC